MTTTPIASTHAQAEPQAPWMPMIIIAMTQILMAFNVNSLQVLIGDIVEDFNTTPGTVSTALVVYSLAVAGFVMLGAKLGKLLGSRLMFQIGVLIVSAAMAGMALSSSPAAMIQYQGLTGLAAAGLVPTLVVLIATHYKGKQQAQCLGLLGGAQALAGVLAFLISGFLGTFLSWRYAFGLLVLFGALIFVMSFRLKPVARQPGVKIDWNGALLVAVAVALISLGFNYLNAWGVLLATNAAPFNILGLSPAPIMVIAGLALGQLFLVWTKLREAANQAPLIAPEVLDSVEERAALYVLLVIGAVGPAINFLIPLYIQIVQGRSSLFTAVAIIPYALAIFVGTAFIVRLFDRLTPRQIGCIGFAVVTVGLTMLAFTVQNSWSTLLVISSLMVIGVGEGALLTLVFNVLVSASPKELAGDVGALRGTANNLSTALGTAIMAAFAVGILSALVTSSVANNPATPSALLRQLNLDNVDFINNDQLLQVLSTTSATPEQTAEAVRINEEARLGALRACFLILAGVTLLAIYPATKLPKYLPNELPNDEPARAKERQKSAAPAA